jgi:ATP-dependent helicase/nuclease subunit B
MQTGVLTLPFGSQFYRQASAWIAGKCLHNVDTLWFPAPRQQQAFLKALSGHIDGPIKLPNLRTFSPTLDTWANSNLQFDVLTDQERWSFFVGEVQRQNPDLAMSRVVALASAVQGVVQHLYSHSLTAEHLETLVPENFYSHWAIYAGLINTTFSAYEAHLNSLGKVDPTYATVRWLEEQAKQVIKSGKTHIALGFADSTPAGRRVLRAIIESGGIVIVPGLAQGDLEAELPAAHPQAPLQELLKDLGAGAYQELVPAPVMHDVCKNLFSDKPVEEHCLESVNVAVADSSVQEVEIISTALRAQASRGMVSALVTPDLTLARQVEGRLSGWGIQVDNSAGTRLTETLYGQLVEQFFTAVTQKWRPTAIVSLLTNPLLTSSTWESGLESFDQYVLRGIKPTPGLGNLLSLARRQGQPVQESYAVVTQRLSIVYDHLPAGIEHSLKDWWQGWKQALDALMAEQKGLFAGREHVLGALDEAVKNFSEQSLTALSAASYLSAVLGQVTLRAPASKETQVYIWGPLEARLQELDFVVVGGLTERQWQPSEHPLLNRAQWAELGVKAPIQSGGLVAHDWCYLMAQQKVLLSYSAKDDGGAPSEPARLISRLQGACSKEAYTKLLRKGEAWRDWVRTDRRRGQANYTLPAQGAVDSALMPEKWSATSLSALLNCPYKAYVRWILGLKEKDEWEEPAGAALRGEVLHKIFEELTNPQGEYAWKGVWSQAEKENILAHANQLVQELLPKLVDSLSLALWEPRFHKILPIFIDEVIASAEAGRTIAAVEEGYVESVDNLTLFAKADRVDTVHGKQVVIDYKTGGSLPSAADIFSGRAPQLGVLGTALGCGKVDDVLLERYSPGGSKVLERFSVQEKLPKGTESVTGWLVDVRVHLQNLAKTLQTADTSLPATPGNLQGMAFGGPCSTCRYQGVCRVQEWGGHVDE